MSENDVSIRIGDLLEKAGLVTTGDLTEAVAVSKRLNMPIGRVLIMSGCVTERLLKAAIEAQSMVRDKLISLDTAIESLGKVSTNNISFQEAVRKTDPTHIAGSSTNKLGEILIEFGVIDQTQLKSALVRSIETGMQLGATLVSMNYLAPTLLPVILHLQDQIRNSVITRAEARAEFESAFAMYKKAKDSFKRNADDNELQSQQQVAAAAAQQQAARNYHAEFFNQQQAPAMPYQQAQPPYPPQQQPYPQPGQPYPGMAPGAMPPNWASQFPGYPPQWGGYPVPPPQPNPYMQPPNAGWPVPYPPADPNGAYTPSGPMPPVGWPGQQQMPPVQPPQGQYPPQQMPPPQVPPANPPAQVPPANPVINQQSIASATISLPPGEIQAASVAEGLMPPAVSNQTTPSFEKVISRQLKQQQGSDQPADDARPQTSAQTFAQTSDGSSASTTGEIAHTYSETDTVPDLPVIRMVSKAYQDALLQQQQSQTEAPKPSNAPEAAERKEKVTDTAQDLPVIRFESHLTEQADSQTAPADLSEAEITLSDFTFEIPGFGQSHKAHTETVHAPSSESIPTPAAEAIPAPAAETIPTPAVEAIPTPAIPAFSPFDVGNQLESHFGGPNIEAQEITSEMPMGPVPQIKGRRTFSDLPSSQQQNPFAQSANPFAPPAQNQSVSASKPNPLAPSSPPPLEQDQLLPAPPAPPPLAPPPPITTPTQAEPSIPAQPPLPSPPASPVEAIPQAPPVEAIPPAPPVEAIPPVPPVQPVPALSQTANMLNPIQPLVIDTSPSINNDTVTSTNPAVSEGKPKKSSPFSALVSGKNETAEPAKPRRSRTRIPAVPSEPAPTINAPVAETTAPVEAVAPVEAAAPVEATEKSDLVSPLIQAYSQAKTAKEPRKSRNRMRALGRITHSDVQAVELAQGPAQVAAQVPAQVPAVVPEEVPAPAPVINETVAETPFVESTKTLELKPIIAAEVASPAPTPTDAAPTDLEQQSEFFAELAKVISPRRRGKNSRVPTEPTTSSENGGNGHNATTHSETHTEQAEHPAPQAIVETDTGVHEVIDVHTGKTTKKSKSKKGSKSSCGELTNPFELLKLAGYFTSEDVQTAFNTAINDPVAVPGLLTLLGLVDAKVIEHTNACQSMLRSGKLKPQQAAFVLSSVRGGKSFDEALDELGIKPVLKV